MAKQYGKPQGMRMTDTDPQAGMMPAERDATEEAMQSLGAAANMTRVATGYTTALVVRKPRKLAELEARVMEEASRMGDSFVYSWRVTTRDPTKDEGDGKTTIEGVSVEGALVLARNWGNCALPTNVESETQTHFVIRSEFIDLETGFTYPRLYRQRKNAANVGKMDPDRGEDISFQIAQSKAQRNVIVRALPSFLIERAVEVAKDKAAEKYANTKEWVPKVLDFATQKLGIPLANLVHRLRGRTPEQWSKFDILALRMAFEGIKNGETTIENEFPPPPPPEQAETKAAAGETVVTPSGAEVQGVRASGETKPAADETKAPAGETKGAPAETAPATPEAKAAAEKAVAAAKTPEQLEQEQAEAFLSAKERAASAAPDFSPPKGRGG